MENQQSHSEEDVQTRQAKNRRLYCIIGIFSVLIVIGIVVGIFLFLRESDSSAPDPIPGPAAPITVAIQLDSNPDETSWRLDCVNLGLVRNVPPGTYASKPNEQIEAFVPEVHEGEDCTFTILDTGNNGLDDGFYEIYYGTDTSNSALRLIAGTGEFTSEAAVRFTVVAAPAPTFVPIFVPIDTPAPAFVPTAFDSKIDDFDTYMNSSNVTDTQREAYESAINWILNEDPMKLTLASTNFEQRFLLAYFYYHVIIEGEKLLGPGQGWLSCGKPDKSLNETDECDLAVLDWNAVDYTYEAGNIRWLSGYPECSWAGVFCVENDEVSAIDLIAQDFTGPLPRELALVSTLKFVGFSHNHFTGTIPTEFASLGRLINIELQSNLFSGKFPIEYTYLEYAFALQRLNFGRNDLTGSLVNEMNPSASIGNLHALKALFVEDNDLSGPFPTEIGTLEFLECARLDRNDFDPGSIPTELGQLTLLQELWLGWCFFTGPVPSEFGMLTELEDLRFENNDLTGPLPDELYALTDLKWLFLEFNRISGTLSPKISQLEELEQLRMRHNEFTGSIPTEMGLLEELLLVYFQFNEFEGPIPDEICANSAIFLPGIGTGNGNLGFLNADCLGDDPATPCHKYCCTACCSRME